MPQGTAFTRGIVEYGNETKKCNLYITAFSAQKCVPDPKMNCRGPNKPTNYHKNQNF